MNITQEFDTICALSTPFGNGGVGVIRISGDKSFPIICEISDKSDYSAGKICYAKISDNKTLIDEVIILPFKAPHSYTGEDVIEIQCHGGINVIKDILDLVVRHGARPAERGEFTKRAFLNKKMDLSQAEAVNDLIHSKTSEFAAQSAKNLSGSLARKIKQIRQDIFDVSSRIVAGIDFPEDVKEPEYSYLIENFEKSISDIDKILAGAKSSDILRQGVKVAIAGRPNVGKSSLFNILLNMDRAIVTDIAGTTRDVINETIDMGIPVTLVDTAGIREDENIDRVEKIGIEYSKQSVNDADLIIFMYDASQGFTKDDEEIYNLIKNKKHLIAANKIDLAPADFESKFKDTIKLSTKTQAGIDELRQKIKTSVLDAPVKDMDFVTNQRRQACLVKCRQSLDNALIAAKDHVLQDMIYIDLKNALLSLDEVTGEVVTDEILDNIFSHFCIGK